MKRILFASGALVAIGAAYGVVRLERNQWQRSLTRALAGPWTV
jgi:hypothetical protein